MRVIQLNQRSRPASSIRRRHLLDLCFLKTSMTSGNVVKPSLFSHAGTNGMSVTRAERAGKEGLIKQQQTRNYVGYVDTTCRAVRGITSDGVRAFCVYDTAQADNRAHADVCQAILRSKSVASQLRRELMLKFGRTPRSAKE